jgi:hypothetical protein
MELSGANPLHVTMLLKSLQVTYYNGYTKTTPNALNGTLGAHEEAHKDFARKFWVTGEIQQIIAANNVSFVVTQPTAKQQADAIGNFLTDLHLAFQQEYVDQMTVTLPAFQGTTN